MALNLHKLGVAALANNLTQFALNYGYHQVIRPIFADYTAYIRSRHEAARSGQSLKVAIDVATHQSTPSGEHRPISWGDTSAVTTDSTLSHTDRLHFV